MSLLGNDTIDSRTVIERIAELRGELDNTPFNDDKYTADELQRILDDTPSEWLDCYNVEEIEELINLLRLGEEVEQYTTEWSSGATLINQDYFKEYAEQYAEDIGAITRNASWPLNHIDWEEAADELKREYTELNEVDGHTYYVRNT